MKKIKNIKIVDPGSSPDVDTDFQTTARGPAFQYVQSKYGFDNVASLITPGPFKVKNSWKAMCTLNEVPPSKANNISKFLPESGGPGTIKSLLEPDNPDGADLRVALSESDLLEKTALDSDLLNGRGKETGVHACGIIISSQPLTNTIPMQKRQDDGAPITQWTYQECEELGLIKMDFLGLKNLSIISTAQKIIKRTYGVDVDLSKLGLDDKKAYELLARGDSTGVFQLESAGMKRYLRELKPSKFEDIIAMVALYRPGPMSEIPKFIARKHGEEPVTYYEDHMENALKNTYGILVYQEQFMQISKEVCGFTGGQADTLRKAVGKKKIDLMKKMKGEFIEGAVKHSNADRGKVEAFWDHLEEFANYCFNKSHAACYALIAYWTAYIKAHYPDAFMAALMTADSDDTDRLAIEIAECRSMGIPPRHRLARACRPGVSSARRS